MIIGYARTSTSDQIAGLKAQLKELQSSGCEKIFSEQTSSVKVRLQLKNALDFVREGDIFVVTKIDRLARSVSDLMSLIKELESKKVAIRILNLGMDTNNPTGKLMLTVLGAVAQFEREIMLERQREGISKAKSEGKYKGRKPIPSDHLAKIHTLLAERITKEEIAKKLGICRATLYRFLSKENNE